MSQRFLCALVLVFFVFGLAAAQQPMRQKTAPMARPRPRSAVTVIDLRNVANEKKPPKRAPDAGYSLRLKSGSRTNATALTAVQVSEALRGAGINVPPPNVYARLSQSQLSVPGKAFMVIGYPDWVNPDRIEFSTTDKNYGGPQVEVYLEEAGTFVFDFLIELDNRPVGGEYGCRVLGYNGETELLVHAEGDSEPVPQHVLVVMNVPAPSHSIGEGYGRVSLQFRPKSDAWRVEWSVFLVDITKL